MQEFRLDPATELMCFCPADRERLCVPAKMHETILPALHDHKGHPGVGKTYDRVRRVVYMAWMKRAVESWVLVCPSRVVSIGHSSGWITTVRYVVVALAL